MSKSLFSLLITSLLLLSSCKTDDEPSSGNSPNTPSSSRTFTCLIDGETFLANAFITDEDGATASDGYYRIASGSFVSGGDTITVKISMIAASISEFVEGASFDSANGNDANRCFGTIYSSSDDTVAVEPGTDEPPATAIITAYDADEEVFSGNFSFEYYDSLSETTIVVTDGVFTDISY